MVSRMRHSVLAAALLASTPALSAGLASSPADESSSSLEGLYAGIAGGGGRLIIPSDTVLAWGVDVRVGYGFAARCRSTCPGRWTAPAAPARPSAPSRS